MSYGNSMGGLYQSCIFFLIILMIYFQVNYNDSVTGQEEEAWNNDMSDFDTDFSGECECHLLSLGMR